jgi:hypothetical protein
MGVLVVVVVQRSTAVVLPMEVMVGLVVAVVQRMPDLPGQQLVAPVGEAAEVVAVRYVMPLEPLAQVVPV